MLNEAISALKAGDKSRAYDLLRQHLAANPDDATAWLWMSEAVSEREQQVEALEQVLRLAPTHSRAPMIRKRLDTLKGAAPVDPAQLEEKAAERLRARLRPGNSPTPAPTPTAKVTEEEVERDDLLARTEPRPSAKRRPTPPLPAAEETEGEMALGDLLARTEPRPSAAPSAPVEPTRQAVAPPPATPRLPDEAPEERASPLPRPRPPQDDVIPAWVWGVMLLSIIILAAFLYAAWLYAGG